MTTSSVLPVLGLVASLSTRGSFKAEIVFVQGLWAPDLDQWQHRYSGSGEYFLGGDVGTRGRRGSRAGSGG